jgi:outer membrane immunogenic protein
MKTKISLATLAAALSIGSAFAADLPSRKAPIIVPPPPPLWTGFYAGLNAGYAFDTDPSTNTWAGPIGANIDNYWNCALPGPGACVGTLGFASALAAAGLGRTSAGAEGFVGGGQLGYNYQFYQSFVAGLEADIQGSGASGNGYFVSGAGTTMVRGNGSSRNFALLDGTEVQKSLDWIGTVRGRIGWLVTPTVLVFATGGFAYGGVSGQTNVFQSATVSPAGFGLWSTSANGGIGSYQQTLYGWTIGGGAEWLVTPNWSVKAEALYYDLGNVTYNTSPTSWTVIRGRSGETTSDFAITQTTANYNGVIVRAGVNYHFNWAPAPVIIASPL